LAHAQTKVFNSTRLISCAGNLADDIAINHESWHNYKMAGPRSTRGYLVIYFFYVPYFQTRQYHRDHSPIRSARARDTCFVSVPKLMATLQTIKLTCGT
jgi:hypothetical protein